MSSTLPSALRLRLEERLKPGGSLSNRVSAQIKRADTGIYPYKCHLILFQQHQLLRLREIANFQLIKINP